MDLINWGIAREPLNWVTVFLMTVFALVLITLVFPEGSQTQTPSS